MASNPYTSGIAKMLGMSPAINYLSDIIKAVLVAPAYTTNVDHDFFSDLTEIPTVTGYTAGWDSASHPVLASKTITVDDANNRVSVDCADPVFGSLGTGATIQAWASYKPLTNAASSPLVVLTDLAADVPTNGAALTGQIDATGLFTVVAS